MLKAKEAALKGIHTLRLWRQPNIPGRAPPGRNELDHYAIITRPWPGSAMKKTEDNNILVFIVEAKANKRQIRQAVKKLCDTYDGQKKACVRLATDYDALEVANKIRII